MLCCLAGCQPDEAKTASKQPPAKVETHPDEAHIYRLTLTPKAVERLGITTTPIERKSVQRHRTFGGEVVTPAGRTIVVSAPLPGTLESPPANATPVPGARVEIGEPIFSMMPLLSPEREVPTVAERVQMANARASLVSAQIVAEGDVKQAQAEVEAAQIALERAQQLLRDKAGSERAVDEATATLNLAQKKLDAAEVRQNVLSDLSLDAERGELQTIDITAPETGILNGLSATPGQTVTAGTPLFEIVNLQTVWVRVPVYVGHTDVIDTQANAIVGDLRGKSNPHGRTATPIAAPPSADAISSTVDLYYSLVNGDGTFYPGERVGVTVPLKQLADDTLVVPSAAVLHDIHGTAWVYAAIDDTVFERRRVLVVYTLDDLAVLAAGPDVGTHVVVDGAAELFGTEFGTGK